MTITQITLAFPTKDDKGKIQPTTTFTVDSRQTIVKVGRSNARVTVITVGLDGNVSVTVEGGKTLIFGNVPYFVVG